MGQINELFNEYINTSHYFDMVKSYGIDCKCFPIFDKIETIIGYDDYILVADLISNINTEHEEFGFVTGITLMTQFLIGCYPSISEISIGNITIHAKTGVQEV